MKANLDDIIQQEYEQQKEAIKEALDEYLKNIDNGDKTASLVSKLVDEAYKKTFTISLMQMSMLISAAMVVDNEKEFSKIKKKILFDSRQDDKDIHEMRLFYLTKITPEDLNNIIVTKEEQDLFSNRLNDFKQDYLSLTKDTAE